MNRSASTGAGRSGRYVARKTTGAVKSAIASARTRRHTRTAPGTSPRGPGALGGGGPGGGGGGGWGGGGAAGGAAEQGGAGGAGVARDGEREPQRERGERPGEHVEQPEPVDPEGAPRVRQDRPQHEHDQRRELAR